MSFLTSPDVFISHCEDKIKQINDVISTRVLTNDQGKLKKYTSC